MRAHTPRQEAEPVAQVSQVEAEGIADRALEPAVHAGAHAAQHHAVVPRLAQRLVHAVHAPDGQHVRGVAAADVDDVLIADERPPLHAARGAEQLQVRRLRAFGFGFSAVLVGIHLERRGLPAGLIGLTLGLGLAAASLSGLVAAWAAARIGRRATLAACGLLMAVTGLDLALAYSPVLLVLAGVPGMLGAASVDLGPFSAVEQAMLAEAAPAKD